MTENRTKRYAAALAVVVVLAALNAFALNTLDAVGIPFILAIALGVQLLLISFVFSLVTVLRTPLMITLSILISAWQGAQTNPYVVSLRRRHPRVSRWVGRRFSGDSPVGLVLTAGVAAAGASALFFCERHRCRCASDLVCGPGRAGP